MRLPTRQRQLREDARILFARPEGKRLLHWMMRRFWVLGGCFDEVPTRHAFFEGERNAILELLELTSLSPGEIEELYRDARFRSAEAQEDDQEDA